VKLDSDEDMMTCEDITELKQAEETLKEREQMLRTILSISPVGIGLTQDRVMKWVNEHPCPVRAQPTMRIRFRSESWHTT
jgi:PAS domain-containing protein